MYIDPRNAGNGSGDGTRPNRSLVQIFTVMTSVSSRLQLSISVKDAWSFYKTAQLLLSKRGYNNLRLNVSVCLYLAALFQRKPRSLEEILTAEFKNPHGKFLKEEARVLMKFLVESLHLELMGSECTRNSSYKRTHSVLLGMGKEGNPAAMKVLKRIGKDFAWMGADVLEAVPLFMAAMRRR